MVIISPQRAGASRQATPRIQIMREHTRPADAMFSKTNSARQRSYGYASIALIESIMTMPHPQDRRLWCIASLFLALLLSDMVRAAEPVAPTVPGVAILVVDTD